MIRVVDFFSGCGGTAAGFSRAGMRISLGIDNDPDAARTYRHNFPGTSFVEKDVRKIRTSDIREFAKKKRGDFLLFSACAPCQPFTRQRRDKRRNDPRATLLWEFLRFVRAYKPDFIFIENVPGLRSASFEKKTFSEFQKRLIHLRYSVEMRTVSSCDYGVPQKRKRLIMLASKHPGMKFPLPTHGPEADLPYVTVWDAIKRYPRIKAGKTHPTVVNHRAAALSARNLRRIRNTPAGGGRDSWPRSLRLSCHDGYNGHSDVYGRMRKNEPSSGLTTRCVSLSNGRFGHPSQDRAITVREAAALQTFGDEFVFLGSLNSTARQVGNAVPVALANAFAMEFRRLARSVSRKRRMASELRR